MNKLLQAVAEAWHGPRDPELDGATLELNTITSNAITVGMEERGLGRSALAGRMRVEPGRVEQILGGGEDLTLRALASVAAGVGAHYEVTLNSTQSPEAE